MRKFLALFIALVMCASLCACSSETIEMNDEGFITNLTNALEARWKISSEPSATEAAAYREQLTKCVDAELAVLGDYSEYTFTDDNLALLAEEYYAALEAQREGIQYYSVDNTLYQQLFSTKGYNKRAEIIYLLNNEYSMQVNSKYASIMSDFLALGEKLHAIEEILEQNLVLESTGNDYELLIENTSKYDLSNAQLNFNLFDDAGVVVHSTSDYLTSWASGSKVKATVYTGNQDFSSAQLNISFFTDGIETDYVPVEIVNNMVIEIEAPDIPIDLNYGYRGNVWSSITVSSFDYEISYWNEGTAGVNLLFSGNKTFDKEGESASNISIFRYKLYDNNNAVVSSGSIYVDALSTGEVFKGASTYATDIAPGSYRLVVEDYMD